MQALKGLLNSVTPRHHTSPVARWPKAFNPIVRRGFSPQFGRGGHPLLMTPNKDETAVRWFCGFLMASSAVILHEKWFHENTYCETNHVKVTPHNDLTDFSLKSRDQLCDHSMIKICSKKVSGRKKMTWTLSFLLGRFWLVESQEAPDGSSGKLKNKTAKI